MVPKIALIGIKLSNNLGGPSLLVSTKMALSNIFPDAEYTLFVPPYSYESDVMLAPRYDVKVAPLNCRKWLLPLALLKRYTGILLGSASDKAIIRSLEKADIVVDIVGIIFADTMGTNTFRGRMREGFRFVIFKILGKPVIKYTADLGPLNYRWNRVFASLYLGHFIDLIFARDEVSRQSVEALGIKTPTIVVPDTAFLLEPSDSNESKRYESFRKEGPIIGLSVSIQAQNRASDTATYQTIMVDFINYMIATFGVRVVLIPNDLSKSDIGDDKLIADEICAKVNSDHCDVAQIENLLAQEIKGVINQCEVIVASRYHTIVASLSLGIPTLAIGWHHKYRGVLKLFKQENLVCNIEELRLESLIENFEYLWNNREEIKKTIISCVPKVKERITNGAKLVRDIVSAKHK